LTIIRRAFAANTLPAVCLWLVAGVLVALYFRSAPIRALLEGLANWKARVGISFSIGAQAFAGAVLPWVFGRFQRGDHRRTEARDVPFLMLIFGLFGATTDVFYRFQAHLWGDDAHLRTLVAKYVCDLGIYNPCFILPILVTGFALKDCDYSFARTRAYLGSDWIVRRMLPIYASALLVWTPTVFALYSLPLALQFPFQAIMQCLWGLILVVLTDNEAEKQVT